MSPDDIITLDIISPLIHNFKVKTVRFADESLKGLETTDDPAFSKGVIKAFRLRMQTIRGARDERDFYVLKSLRFKKLEGQRKHQYSMRLNKQFRLILQFEGSGQDKTVVVVGIEDYH